MAEQAAGTVILLPTLRQRMELCQAAEAAGVVRFRRGNTAVRAALELSM